MAGGDRTYISIDLKSFYASVECLERGLDPMDTLLVVADAGRTEKTICLAVSPSLKAYGIPGRARLFQVVEQVKQANARRRVAASGGKLSGSSFSASELERAPELAAEYVIAPPRMALYIEYSTRIYNVYLKYIAPEDIQVYSIDEVFMDVTDYLGTYGLSARELAMKMILDVLDTTGITSTAGIGTNMYLCKVALDIVSKHIEPDENGVRIADLDEDSYRRLLWGHRPITDFWRVGRGYAAKLAEYGMFTMGDVARCSLGAEGDFYSEDLLYRLFGVNAELLIDHAWGWEPCTIADIKAYKPETKSIVSGQVLQCPYDFKKGRLAVREMADLLALELVDKGLETDQVILTVGYDIENLTDPDRRSSYKGEVTVDRYGRRIPKHAHGTVHLGGNTSSARRIIAAVSELYDRIVDEKLLIRRLSVTAGDVTPEGQGQPEETFEQMDMFTDYEARDRERTARAQETEKEKKMQKALLDIKKKFGKNAVLRGMNFEEGATARDRNGRIGGHRA